MTFSPAQFQENIGKNEPLPLRVRSYFKQRFQQKAFARLAKAFADRAEQSGLSKSGIALLIDRDKAQVNRLLAHPSNMTLDTFAELCLALNYEPTIALEDLSEAPRHNFCHSSYREQLPGLTRSSDTGSRPYYRIKLMTTEAEDA